jgi:hypothetical protein
MTDIDAKLLKENKERVQKTLDRSKVIHTLEVAVGKSHVQGEVKFVDEFITYI